MSTDDEIRDAFHTAFSPAVGGLTADPAMLSAVRRRHARQQRILAVGAPVGVAVLTAGAVVGVHAVHSNADNTPLPIGNGSSPTADPSPGDQTVVPSQSVAMLTHTMSVPGDWTLSGNRKLINLDTIQPAQPVGGKDQSVIATSPDGSQQFSATVYHGAIASGESTEAPDVGDRGVQSLSINGTDATFVVSDGSGPCVTVTPANPQPSKQQIRHMIKNAKPGHAKSVGAVKSIEVPCGETGITKAGPFSNGGYAYSDGDFMLFDTRGMTSDEISAFLQTALG